MNKICGYSCEHNKGGVCQITMCDKQPTFNTTTENYMQVIEGTGMYYEWYVKHLQEELEEEKRINQENLKLIDELQQRIEKAIRLTEEYHYYVFTKDIETIYKNANDEFINILRGDEE